MKIFVEREKLLESVSNLSRAVMAGGTVPVLQGILLSAENSCLTMMAYNTEMGMTKTLPIRCEKQGDVVINAKLLLEILRKQKGESVEIEVEENFLCHIRSLGAQFDLSGMKSTDFPEMPSVAVNKKLIINAQTLKDMVRQTAFAAASEETVRKVLSGIYFNLSAGVLKLVAIDGNRLAIRKTRVENSEDMSFIVSAKSVSEAIKIAGGEQEDIVLKIGKTHISFESDGYTVISRLIEGEYIDYMRSIPPQSTFELTLDTKELIDVIDRISLIINDSFKTPVRLTFENNLITFNSVSAIGRAKDEMAVNYKGDKFEIGFNSKYLLDAIKATEEENIVIRFNNDVSAVSILPTEGDDFLYLVMPMKIR